jgi:D-glycero-D-manno-heptose 1,7-bisphosphate phosphatase
LKLVSDPDLLRRRAAFLDRDGVINVDHGYVFRRADFEFVDGALEASAILAERGFALVVVTNQSGIARGLYSEADFAVLNAWMTAEFASAGAPLAGVYFCPHHPQHGRGTYRIECDCRKPAPGMLLQAARELDLDLTRSVLFGDKRHDLEAAANAGVPTRVLLATNGLGLPAELDRALFSARFRSLGDAVASAEFWKLLGEASHAR